MRNFNELLYSTTIFLSALLFSIEPMFSKGLLPLFGGGSVVWITSILFYQSILLIGYLYAAVLCAHLSEKKQLILHSIVLGLSLLFIPISIKPELVFNYIWPPFNVLFLLTISVFMPFMVITSTAPLLSRWYYSIDQDHFVYKLYALSNLGCLIGIIGYPFLLEYFLGLKLQLKLWSIAYIAYIILMGVCGWLFYKKHRLQKQIRIHEKMTIDAILKWIAYSFLASALLYGVTQFLVQNAINLPLMWVVPLGLFLIAYAVVFSKPQSYDVGFWGTSYIIWLILTALIIYNSSWVGFSVVIILLALLYCGCMVSLGELFNRRPEQGHITAYYAYIALGGVMGGAFIHFASFYFTRMWDFYLILIIVALIVLRSQIQLYKKIKNIWNHSLAWMCALGFIFFIVALGIDIVQSSETVIARVRNIFGLLQVKQYTFDDHDYDYRVLLHGKVIHGMEFLRSDRALIPTTYFGKNSGLGWAMRYLDHRQEKKSIGVIGLGAGTITTWARPQDSIQYYEIDPDMVGIAKHYFHYLRSHPTTKIVVGDARIVLQKEIEDQQRPLYDILIVDAFGGDVIPFHVITAEAMQLYLKHLKPNGIIAIHTSNTYLDLYPVTLGCAQTIHYTHYWIASPSDIETGNMRATWALMTQDPQWGLFLKQHRVQEIRKPLKPVFWTDDYNSILPLIKWRSI